MRFPPPLPSACASSGTKSSAWSGDLFLPSNFTDNRNIEKQRKHMNHTVVAYLIYLPVAVAMTIWVARTLHKNGRVFLVQAFRGKEDMADSVNHLLVVGFYLINIGFIAAALRYGDKPHDAQETIEFLSTKLGIVDRKSV